MNAPAAPAGEQALAQATIAIDGEDLPTWPGGQAIEPIRAPLMATTRFADHSRFHPQLKTCVGAMEHDPAFRMWIFKGGCGLKVRRVDRWHHAAADLIHARALNLAHRVLSKHAVFNDDCWASVYRRGDYCMPHSHLRANVSIVYMLEPGDPDAEDEMAGRLVFADPRIPYCCPLEHGRVTNLLLPDMDEGTMLVFAGDYLHSVNPYRGERPRITLSWNVTVAPLEGQAGDGWT